MTGETPKAVAEAYLVHVGVREQLAVGLEHDEAVADEDLSALDDSVEDAVDFRLADHLRIKFNYDQN